MPADGATSAPHKKPEISASLRRGISTKCMLIGYVFTTAPGTDPSDTVRSGDAPPGTHSKGTRRAERRKVLCSDHPTKSRP